MEGECYFGKVLVEKKSHIKLYVPSVSSLMGHKEWIVQDDGAMIKTREEESLSGGVAQQH